MAGALADDTARRSAMAVHDQTFLVEAGAGSGKTAVMAGRIAMVLASGVRPKDIAAVTFTELSASELLFRVRDVVAQLSAGAVPAELRVALPAGLSPDQLAQLRAAEVRIDEITCSTIHGFCQRLIKPYPVEADIDPGASVMDRDQADLAFLETRDTWLREELDQEGGGVLAELILRDPGRTVALIATILDHMRRRRRLDVDSPPDLAPMLASFRQAAEAFEDFIASSVAEEPETSQISERFSQMAQTPAIAAPPQSPADYVQLLLERPHVELCTKSGSFRAFQKKTKWVEAAKQAGLSKADGEALNVKAFALNEACCKAWHTLLGGVAARVLADLVAAVQPVLDRFRVMKRTSALLDFDDLIFAARDLLRDHAEVREALARRYPYVLVDEFQDTDPLQTEIFWRLCGEPSGENEEDWTAWVIRPGALFLVGDPKQAIYRFRGADVAAYVLARDTLADQSPQAVLSISTNFRSCAPILEYVNDRFASQLSVEQGQPGFTALDSFHLAPEGAVCVAALDVAVAGENGKATAEQQRDGEAEAVAELCARLIGSAPILDRKTGEQRPCRPGDIALLAPTGSELWRYEEALERRGVPVATQAGKGLFRRQEIQDLIALTRVLADSRDTLALGALLRGPLVGLTEEELLDLVWALPRHLERPEELPLLRVDIDVAEVVHAHAREVFERLQSLRRSVNSTTPHDLLSQAVDVLRLRPILQQRHGGQADSDRALANVDLYLSFSLAYAGRGLRAFAETMTSAWEDQARAVEGRPDAQEEAVALYTMHAAKGLEWPIVVPINTMTQVMSPENAITNRQTGRFHCPVFGVAPTGYDDALAAEKDELNRERVRLWYVAATRARELLVLPRLDVPPRSSAWVGLVDLGLADLQVLKTDHLPLDLPPSADDEENLQTRSVFADEAAIIAGTARRVRWCAPSRDESSTGPVLAPVEPQLTMADPDSLSEDGGTTIAVRGSRDRGVILHKLLEEVLTGETGEDEAELRLRAQTLIQDLGAQAEVDPVLGLSPNELAATVAKTLALPEVAAFRPGLLPEFPIYDAKQVGDLEEVTNGVADAISLSEDGTPSVVVDWKSDVNPSPETLDHYRAQVGAYLAATSAAKGLIVLLTTGRVIEVRPHAA